jgi:hypothetical protein
MTTTLTVRFKSSPESRNISVVQRARLGDNFIDVDSSRSHQRLVAKLTRFTLVVVPFGPSFNDADKYELNGCCS